MLWQVAINAKVTAICLKSQINQPYYPPPGVTPLFSKPPPLSETPPPPFPKTRFLPKTRCLVENKVFVDNLACCRCIVGHEPREFDASRGLVLSNLSEMLVRQLEHKWAESEARQSSVQLMRSLACYEEAFFFLDTSREGDWRVLHMNLAASKLLGRHIVLT